MFYDALYKGCTSNSQIKKKTTVILRKRLK